AIPFNLSVDLQLLAFTGGLALLTGFLFGLAPALATTRLDLVPILKGNGSGGESRPQHFRTTDALVVLQVALSLVLLIASGLMIRSLRALYEVNFGFEREEVVVSWILPALAGYDHAKEMSLYRELHERLNSTPGIRSASLSRFRMVTGGLSRDV